MKFLITSKNKEKALRCMIKNSTLNGMGFYKANGGSSQVYLSKLFPKYSKEEIYNLLKSMEKDGILQNCDTTYSEYTCEMNFLEEVATSKKDDRRENIRYAITIVIAALAALSGWLAFLLKP